MKGPTRRGLLTGGAGLALGVVVTEGAHQLTDDDTPPGSSEAAPTKPTGRTQAGVDRPETPPSHLYLHALKAPAGLDANSLGATLARVGDLALDLVEAIPRGEDLTVQVGIGATLVALSSATGKPDVTLPAFKGSKKVDPARRSADLFLLVAATRPEIAAGATDSLLGSLPGFPPRWSQLGFRAQGKGPVTRNPLGFRDGIVQPKVVDGVPEHVWLPQGPWAGSTIGVVRRFVLDVGAFSALDTAGQEAVFGRKKSSGAPLSGGGPDANVKLGAKSPEGRYLVPADSHVRAAHPSFTDSTLMVRRSYGFRASVDGEPDRSGLLFLCYQDDVSVFAKTQARMDRMDRLMDFATPTAESAFLVLPGFDRQHPLGSTLFG